MHISIPDSPITSEPIHYTHAIQRHTKEADATILLSSAGRRVGLVSALRSGAARVGVSVRIVATDCSELSAAARLCDAFYLVPKANEPDFLDALLHIAEAEGPLLVIPTIDPELGVLAENHKRLLDASADVLISHSDTVEICADKAMSSSWLRTHSFPAPLQYSWDQIAKLDKGGWPLFFKPLYGSSSVGAHQIDSLLQAAIAVERHGQGVFEELLSGPEYTVDCWVDPHGQCRAAVPRLRLATRSGEVSKARTIRLDALETLAATICETLPGARGPITIQAILDSDHLRIIEINPRFAGGYPITHEAGGLFAAAAVAEASGATYDPSWFGWRADVTMLRYDEAVFYDAQPQGDV